MRSAVLRWFDQAVAALRERMDRPWTLFLALLAVTPYRPAIALAAFGLDQIFKARYKIALVLLVGAGLMHPLMTVGGVLLFAGWWAVERLGWCRAHLIAAPLAVAAAAVFAYQPPGARVFRNMDDERRDYTRRDCPMNFPAEWNLLDRVHPGAGFTSYAADFGDAPVRHVCGRRLSRNGEGASGHGRLLGSPLNPLWQKES